MAHLETELEQSRLRETETLGALREMQDKVLDMEKVCRGEPWAGGTARSQQGRNSQGLSPKGTCCSPARDASVCSPP